MEENKDSTVEDNKMEEEPEESVTIGKETKQCMYH